MRLCFNLAGQGIGDEINFESIIPKFKEINIIFSELTRNTHLANESYVKLQYIAIKDETNNIKNILQNFSTKTLI